MLKSYLEFPRAVYLLCLGSFINRAGTFLLPFLTFYLVDELGLSVSFATMAMGVYGAGSIAGALLGGHLADRIGRRPVMLISLLGGAVVLRFFGLLGNPASILPGVFVFTVMAEMYRPAASAMIADLVGAQRRTHAFGLMYVAINLGFAVGALVGGWLATVWYTWLFWGDALTAGLYALILILFIGETRPTQPSPADPSVPNPDTQFPRPPPVRFVRQVLADRTFVVFCVAALLCGLVYLQGMSTFPLYLNSLGFGPDTYGRLISVNGWLIVLFQLPITSFITRYHRGTVVACAALILAFGFGAKAFSQTAWQFQAAVVIWTVSEMMQAPLMSAIVTDLAPAHLRARYLGVFSMVFSSANMLGAPLGGMMLQRWGGRLLWLVTCCLALAAAGLFVLLRPRLGSRDEGPGSAHAARAAPDETPDPI